MRSPTLAAITPGAAASNKAQNKIVKYAKLTSTHIFYPLAIDTADTWHDMAIELIGSTSAQ